MLFYVYYFIYMPDSVINIILASDLSFHFVHFQF